MDEFTAGHFAAWQANQFPEGIEDALVGAMLSTYADDPQHWDSAGWWRLYDAAVAALG